MSERLHPVSNIIAAATTPFLVEFYHEEVGPYTRTIIAAHPYYLEQFKEFLRSLGYDPKVGGALMLKTTDAVALMSCLRRMSFETDFSNPDYGAFKRVLNQSMFDQLLTELKNHKALRQD